MVGVIANELLGSHHLYVHKRPTSVSIRFGRFGGLPLRSEEGVPIDWLNLEGSRSPRNDWEALLSAPQKTPTGT
jgi:hypothetical protein